MLIFDNLGRFVEGAWVTLQLTFLALLLGGLVAIPLAIARAYRKPVLNQIIWGYTYAFRGTPLLVQTYLFYFGLGQFEAVRNSFLWDPILSDPWWCVLIAAAMVAVFEYSFLIFASLWAFLLWGTATNLLAWVGITVILMSGLLMTVAQKTINTDTGAVAPRPKTL